MHTIFLKYHENDKEVGEEIRGQLEETGLNIKFGKTSAPVGENIWDYYYKSIKECSFTFVIISKNSIGSWEFPLFSLWEGLMIERGMKEEKNLNDLTIIPLFLDSSYNDQTFFRDSLNEVNSLLETKKAELLELTKTDDENSLWIEQKVRLRKYKEAFPLVVQWLKSSKGFDVSEGMIHESIQEIVNWINLRYIKKRSTFFDFPSPYYYMACDRKLQRQFFETYFEGLFNTRKKIHLSIFISREEDRLFSFLVDFLERFNEENGNKIFGYHNISEILESRNKLMFDEKIIKIQSFPIGSSYDSLLKKNFPSNELSFHERKRSKLNGKSVISRSILADDILKMCRGRKEKPYFIILPCEITLDPEVNYDEDDEVDIFNTFKNREEVLACLKGVVENFWSNVTFEEDDPMVFACLNIKYRKNQTYEYSKENLFNKWLPIKKNKVQLEGKAAAKNLAEYLLKDLEGSQNIECKIHDFWTGLDISKEDLLEFLTGPSAINRFKKEYPSFKQMILKSSLYQELSEKITMRKAEEFLRKCLELHSNN